MTVQKINPRAGFTQLSGSGSPEGVIAGYIGQKYRDTSNNVLYEKVSGDNTNTGWTLINGLVCSKHFIGASTVLYSDTYFDFRWDGTNKQLQYYPKFPLATWHDAGIVIFKGTSSFISTDDIQPVVNAWHYFSNGGTLDANFNIGNYGHFGIAHVCREGFDSSIPAYRLEFGAGNSTSIHVQIFKITN